ncbi:hypothetical protein LEL_08245 [Akanthomyces lecanii RCEF 1005]|uniref:Heat-labile enterotoxin IIA, A chain n=1 Tax=Akanthomyces lecanii RCEF 1005 TaxID=1081108 RepID=A0A162LRR5_CORDF|nr:hypothetical protein LEL_08245 [Akanthomyces lecanii RCEF 1005]
MKIAILHLALLGLSSAHVANLARVPQGPTPPGQLIGDAIKAGIKDWGPAGSLKPPSSPKPPLRQMPGSPVPYHKPKDPNIKTGVTRIPGQPLGPQKKCKPCFRKRDICCDSSGKPAKPAKAPAKGPSKANKPYKMARFSVPKSAGRAAVFMLVAPYAHSALDSIKQWDNPIGHGVKWFDDAMASLQEAIGGPQRDDIYGNELKYKMIKGIGGALQLGFETDWDKNQRLQAEAAAKEEARRQEEDKEKQRIQGLEELAVVCEKMGTEQPEDAELTTQIQQSCTKLADAVKRVQAREAAEAKKKVKPEAFYWFGKCKVSLSPSPS